MQATATTDWYPGKSTLLLWNVLSLVLMVVGILLFAGLFGLTHDEVGADLAGSEMLIGLLSTIILTFGLMMFHEWIHGQAIRRYGGKPIYGFAVVAAVMPVFFCTARETQFTRRQFLVIALAPFVVVTLLCVVVVMGIPGGGWLVVPAAVHLAGCIGDFGMSIVVSRLAPGVLVEDLKTGMRFHPPASH